MIRKIDVKIGRKLESISRKDAVGSKKVTSQDIAFAGTLEHGYLRTGPLPRVPLRDQSTLVC